jgi:NAD+ synthase
MTKSAEELLKIDAGATAKGIEKYIRNAVDENGVKGVALGLSGGLDSAVVAPLAVRALGKDNVHVYFVNSKECDKESQDMARLVADWLGLKLNIESVEEVMRKKEESASFFKRLSHLPPSVISALESLYYWVMGETVYMTSLRKNEFKDGSFKKWLYENMIKDIVTMFDGVSIARRKLLEGICEKEKWILIGAGNGSETKTGWFNIGGLDDMPYSPINDLYKTQVRQLAEYLEVPVAIRNRKPIPDGLKGVTDASVLSMGYDKADIILYGIEHQLQDEEIMQYGLTKKEIERMRKINTLSEWKRAAGRE